jgi:hypothetical protein
MSVIHPQPINGGASDRGFALYNRMVFGPFKMIVPPLPARMKKGFLSSCPGINPGRMITFE